MGGAVSAGRRAFVGGVPKAGESGWVALAGVDQAGDASGDRGIKMTAYQGQQAIKDEYVARMKYTELIYESVQKAIASETEALHERLIEVEASHAAAMIRFSEHHHARMRRDGVMMAWSSVLSWIAGAGMAWGFFSLRGG